MTNKTIVIPLPIVRPLGQEIDCEGVQMVWDTFIKPGQDSGNPQSIEERYLMAILRAVYQGLMPSKPEVQEPKSTC